MTTRPLVNVIMPFIQSTLTIYHAFSYSSSFRIKSNHVRKNENQTPYPTLSTCVPHLRPNNVKLLIKLGL